MENKENINDDIEKENKKIEKYNKKLERMRLYYENNRDRIKTLNLEKYHNNPDKYIQYQKNYILQRNEEIKQIKNTKYKCDVCCGNYTYANYCKHIMTKKHLESFKAGQHILNSN